MTVTHRSRRRFGDLKIALLFIAPATLGFLVFYLYPAIRGFYFAFTEYNLLGTPKWVGLDNFVAAANDPVFFESLKVTFWYVILNISFQTALALVLAVLMHRVTKSSLVRGTLLMPWMISNVVAAMIWAWLLDYQIGLVNTTIEGLGLDKIAFFGNEAWAIPTIAFVNVWRHLGYTALLIFAGLQTIPTYVYEAASIDGSTEWQSFWRITLPLLRPVLVMVLVLSLIGSFQIFDTVAVTTKGGPIQRDAGDQYYIFQKEGFSEGQFGYASALSLVLFFILLIVSLIQMRVMRANESDLA